MIKTTCVSVFGKAHDKYTLMSFLYQRDNFGCNNLIVFI
jgi:hypothetical protein